MPDIDKPARRIPVKKILLIGGSLVIIALIAFGTITLLSHLATKDASNSQSAKSPKEQAAEKAAQELKSAQSHEAKGETAKAIDSYKQALTEYQKAGDKAGEEGVKLQIKYLESLNEQ